MFLLGLSRVQYDQVYWIYFCLFTFFSRHPISFLVEMLIVISDPHMQETDLTQIHQLNIQTILLLYFCLYVEQVDHCVRLMKFNFNQMD